ncbi:MAG: peptidoglycan DD-metalloendopeptidase family protein [Oscillospiraceae bacterium]|nr:peptidoglycan DD-metalloendopeptidase family protein [Oscillospiraceae bacterium]MBQ7129703.1 peptidoglycan DD-metalloendopeptidase family protein [Oscillospiraceae bacterium]
MNRKPLTSLLSLILAAVMLIGVMPTPASASKSSSAIQSELDALKSENKDLQREINAIQNQYDANASEIQNLVNKKNAIDQEIALLSAQVENLNSQISAYSQLIADAQDELDIAQFSLNGLNEKHKLRIRAMEEEGKVSYWEVIFEASDFTDMLDRINMMQEIAASDQARLEEMRQAAAAVSQAQSEMEQGKREMEESSAALETSMAEMEIKRTESDDILRELAKKQDEFQAMLDESEALQDELMLDIAAKEKELKDAKYEEKLAALAASGGAPASNATWRTPVSGYTLTSPFGMRMHPVLGYMRMHNGIDMACAQGTPIYATRAGTVTTASYQAGGAGYYVSINHLDGFSSIYMHMTHFVVSAGQSVAQGQLIGYVGSTGISTGPHLHFGISYAGSYVNPLAYIY